jgi:hypothetical protein
MERNVIRNYKVHFQRKKIVVNERVNGTWLPSSATELVMSFWCFSSGIAMEELIYEGARSIILASGTLVPSPDLGATRELCG